MRFFILILIVMGQQFSFGQKPEFDLENYKWKNRLVLIITQDLLSKTSEKQLAEFSEDRAGLLERKLLVFQITPEVTVLFNKGKPIEECEDSSIERVEFHSDLYKQYVDKDEAFELILIGLDGTIKLRQDKLLKREKLFTIIDGMPMRKAEIRKKN